MYIQSYKELIVWQKSVILVKEVYIATEKFPKSEMHGLTSQLRRAAISIPSNIAEGYRSKSKKEFGHACSIAYVLHLRLKHRLLSVKNLIF
jgi:four helix bundle protein